MLLLRYLILLSEKKMNSCKEYSKFDKTDKYC